MKMQFTLTLGLALALNACGGHSSASLSTAPAPIEAVATKIDAPSDKDSTAVAVSLLSSVTLSDIKVSHQYGWVVMSWNAEETGEATLEFNRATSDASQFTLQIGAGEAALLIDGSEKVLKKGEILGQRTYVCGPQGKKCKESIRQVRADELSFRCGPQGEICSIELPF